VFSDPEVATVGLTETRLGYAMGLWTYQDSFQSPASRAVGRDKITLMKLVVARATRKWLARTWSGECAEIIQGHRDCPQGGKRRRANLMRQSASNPTAPEEFVTMRESALSSNEQCNIGRKHHGRVCSANYSGACRSSDHRRRGP